MIVATAVVADAHVTWPVRFCVVLSLNVPVAVNCCVIPFAIDGLAGVTAIDCSAAAVTVSTVEPVTAAQRRADRARPGRHARRQTRRA